MVHAELCLKRILQVRGLCSDGLASSHPGRGPGAHPGVIAMLCLSLWPRPPGETPWAGRCRARTPGSPPGCPHRMLLATQGQRRVAPGAGAVPPPPHAQRFWSQRFPGGAKPRLECRAALGARAPTASPPRAPGRESAICSVTGPQRPGHHPPQRAQGFRPLPGPRLRLPRPHPGLPVPCLSAPTVAGDGPRGGGGRGKAGWLPQKVVSAVCTPA